MADAKRFSVFVLLLPLLLLSAASTARSQCTPIYTFSGETPDSWLGAVSGAGDVNGDGFDDVIVGAGNDNTVGEQSGRACIYSGQTGELIRVFNGESAFDWFGSSVSGAGDVNGDGYDDVIVGARGHDAGGNDAGKAYVFSGLDGTLLHAFLGEEYGDWFGSSVSGAGDVNGDGFDDLIVGAPWANVWDEDNHYEAAGRVYVFSGATGTLIHLFEGESGFDRFGTALSGAADIDGDGLDDVIVGAWLNDAGGEDAGRVYVYSGGTGDLLYVFTGEIADGYFGNSVSGAGDIDGDGFGDIVVGASHGEAYVYSGQTGTLLFSIKIPGGAYAMVSDAGDVNADGFGDVIIGMWNVLEAAYIFAGPDGQQLHQFAGENDGDSFGNSVSGAGDTNGDGFDEVIVGAPRWNNKTGRAYLFNCNSQPIPTLSEWGALIFGVLLLSSVLLYLMRRRTSSQCQPLPRS